MRSPNSPDRINFVFKPDFFEDAAGLMDYQFVTDMLEASRDHDLRSQARRRRQVTLTPEVYARVEAEARERGVVPETLVNLWIYEHLDQLD